MVTYSAHIKLNLHCVVGRTQALHDSFCCHLSARLNDDQGDMPHRHLVNWLMLCDSPLLVRLKKLITLRSL